MPKPTSFSRGSLTVAELFGLLDESERPSCDSFYSHHQPWHLKGAEIVWLGLLTLADDEESLAHRAGADATTRSTLDSLRVGFSRHAPSPAVRPGRR